MSVSEKVAYLRGLMEGLDIDDDKKEGKMFAAIIDALDEIASDLSDIDEDLEDLTDYVEELCFFLIFIHIKTFHKAS